jgi:multiple sugar transport system ATP-binding protein
MATVAGIGVTKHFGPVKAVDGIDFSIKDGEFLVLLGPSGSGKTTLMRLLAGLEMPTDGKVMIDGQVVNELPPRARGIAMVFQSYALYPHKTVFNNIAFPLKVEGLGRDEIRKKVEWAAGILHIGHLLDRLPSQVSGGEKQRVAIARALVRRPKVLIMDEPLSNLDAKVRHMARNELKKFQREVGVTTVYVTHDQVEAMGLGDRIAVMHEGRISQIGTPDDIYHQPADVFVAGFIGLPPMNFIPQGDAILSFRPENFLPAELVTDGDRLDFRFSVERIENLGSYHLIYGLVGQARVIANLSCVSTLACTVPVEPGRTYDFSVRRADVRYFDAASGARIVK